MQISSLDELKTKVGHVIVMILLVKMFERSKMVTISTGMDLLSYSVCIFLSSASLYILHNLHRQEQGFEIFNRKKKCNISLCLGADVLVPKECLRNFWKHLPDNSYKSCMTPLFYIALGEVYNHIVDGFVKEHSCHLMKYNTQLKLFQPK